MQCTDLAACRYSKSMCSPRLVVNLRVPVRVRVRLRVRVRVRLRVRVRFFCRLLVFLSNAL